MKTLCICLFLLAAGNDWSEEVMTPKQFRDLVGTPGEDHEISAPEWVRAQ